MTTVTIDAVVARWTDPAARPLFRGQLIDKSGCCCAQGDILRMCGWSDEDLRSTAQRAADAAVASALGISRFQAILLRVVNDRANGCPQDVLAHPQRVLGPDAPTLLAFGRHLDRMTDAQWDAVGAVGSTVSDAAWGAAEEEVEAAAESWPEGWAAAKEAAADATVGSEYGTKWAVAEIMGARTLREHGWSFVFLPMFGFADPEAVMAADNPGANATP